MLVLSYPIKNRTLIAPGNVLYQWLYRFVWVIFFLLLAGAAFSQSPVIVRTINPTGGLTGGDLKIDIYSDGSYTVMRNGKSESYDSTYENPIRGINTLVRLEDNALETIHERWFGMNTLPNTCYVSPISGSGTALDPWKVQVMGQMTNLQNQPFLLQYTINYVKDNAYFFLDYMLHLTNGGNQSKAHLYLTEATVMGANLPLTITDMSSNSKCMEAFVSGDHNTVGVYRTTALSCSTVDVSQRDRSHIIINKTNTAEGLGFTSYFAGNANNRQTLDDNHYFPNTSIGSIFSEKGIGVHRYVGIYTSTKNLKTARFLVGYGTTQTEFDNVPGIANPALETDVAVPLTVQFEGLTASGAEGDNAHSIQGLNLRVIALPTTPAKLPADQYVRLKLIPDASITNPASEHVDFEYEDFRIPAGTYVNGQLIPVTSVKILGNTQLQYNRKMKFELASCNTLVKVGSTTQCTYEIVDDEDRRITIAPKYKDVHEGQDTMISVHLPAGVVPSMDIKVQLSVLPTSTIVASAYHLNLASADSTVTIKATNNDTAFKLRVPANKILERNKVLKLHAEATVYGQLVTADTTINIIDSTRLDPANTIIKIESTPDEFQEGTTPEVKLSLPTGITTAVPIPVTLSTAGSTATVVEDYLSFPTTVTIDSATSAVSFNVDVKTDDLVEKTEILKLDATAHDGLTAFTVIGKSIDIEDSNDPSTIAFQFNFSQNPLTPGGAGALVSISLPSPLKAGYDIPVNIDKGKSSTVVDGMHTVFPTGPFTILKNTSSISIPGTIDAFSGDTQDRTLVFVASATDFKTDSAMLPIINVDWNNPANKVIALEIVSNPFMEGTQSDLKVSFVNTVAWTSDINIDLTRDAASTAVLSDDYTLAANTIKLPAGKRDTVYQNFVTAVSDRIFKTTKGLILKGSTLTSGGFSITNASRDIEDTTSLNAANKNISIATSSSEMIEGTTYDVTFSLPAGVTTAIPINISVVPVTGSPFTAADYIISTPPVINNGSTVTVQITIKDDGVLTGPATRELKLTGTSASLPDLVFGEATITVKDKDYVPNMAFDITVNPTSKEIVEGAATGAAIMLTLPGGLKAGYAIPVMISKGLSSQAGDSRHTAVPGNYTIAKDAFSVIIPVIKANADNILNNDASVVVVAAATGFKKDSVALLIKDATASVPANKALTLEVMSTPLEEGKKSDLKISFNNNVSATTDINILLSRNVGNSTANTPGDYTLAYTTVKLPAGKRDTVLTDFITATSDRVFKPAKTLQLDGTATGYTITAASCTIEDTTSLNAANKNISIVTSSSEMIEGTTYDVTFSLPAGVTTAIPINISVVPVTGSPFTAADYIISTPSVINNGSTVTVQITIKDDGVLTGPATRELKLTGTSTSLSGLVFGEATITVKDKDYVPNMAFDITVNPANKEIVEGAATGAAITLTLPDGLKAGYAIPVTISKGLSSQAGDSRHTAVPGNYTIAKDAFSVTIPVIKANADNILNNDASVVVVAAATGFKKDSVALLIKDATASVPANKALTLEVMSTPLEEGKKSDLKISFNNNVSATTDINILLSRNVGNSTANTPGDYTLAYTTVKLPAGKRDTVLTDFITATSDRVFKPAKTLQLDGTATGYTITAASCTIEDTTSLNAANKNISIVTSSAEMIEGTTYDVTFSLPAGVTTAIPINISVVPVTGSPFTAADYIISTPPVINNGGTVTVQITIKDDGVLTGPATRELKLTGTSTSLPGLVFGEATITVKDKDYVPNMAFDITVNPASKEIVEGAATGAAVTLTLPDGLKAGYAIPVTISKGLSSQAGDSRHTAVPGNYTIAKDAFSVTIPVIKANADNILNNDASVVVVAEATGFKKDSVALLIKDATASVPANKALTLEVMSTPLEEGKKSDLKISFNNNVSATTDINILLSRNVGNSTANTPGDYTLAYTTVKLPAGKRDTVLTDFITATSDRVFKPAKTLQLDGTATGYTITAASCTIEDTTSLNAANKNISIATSSAEMIEGTTYDVTFSLPAGVTTAIPINISVVPVTGSPFTTADYIISTPPVINNGGTVTVQITIKDDGVLTGPATRELKLTGTSTSLSGLVFGEATITVKDKDYVPNMAFDITVNPASKEIVEGASTGAAVTLTLPDGLKAGYAIPVTISKGLSSQAGDSRHTAVPGNYTIAKDAFSVTIPVIKANADNILNNDASVVVVAEATGFKKDSVALLIKDATASVPANKALTLEVMSTPLQEGKKSDLKISFNNNVSATTDINILLSRNVGNSTANTPGDYTLAYTTVKLPAGKRDTVLTDFITATSDRVFKPAKTLQLDGTATGYTITAASCTIEDTTSLNAANKNISIATSSAEMIEGTTYDVTFSLPAGVTTAIPINISVVPVTGSPFTTADYIISTPPVINNGGTVTVQITIKDDGVLTGPAMRELKLTGTSTSLSGLVFGEATITVKDKDYVPNMAFDITVNPANKEIIGGAATGATIKLSLPNGLKAGYNIPVVITKGLSSVAANARHTIIPGTYIIEKDKQSVTLDEIKALGNNVLGDDEKLVVVARANNFKEDSVTLTIKGLTTGKVVLTGVTPGNSVSEGKSYKIRAALAGGLVTNKPVHVKISSSVLSAATIGKYDIIPAEFDITAALGYFEFEVKAKPNNILDGRQLLRLTGMVTNFPGIVLDSLDIYIDDATDKEPGNLKLTMKIDSAILHRGSESKVTIGFENPLITSTTAIPLTINREASSTLKIGGYELLPDNITLPAGKSAITFKLRIKQDNAPKDNEILQLLVTAVPATFTVSKPGKVTIPGPGIMNVLLEKKADAAEPATNGGFIVKLGDNKVAPQNVKVTLLVNDLSGFTNIIPFQTEVIIPEGKNSVSVPVNIVDNYLIEGDKTITVKVKAAQVTIQGEAYALKFNAQDAVNVLVSDDETSAATEKAAQRKIKIVKKNDAQEPDIAGAFIVKFTDERITATQDVKINYVVSGSATPGVDYQNLTGNIIIPAGKNEGIIQIIPIEDENTETTETVQLKLDKATSSLSSVTWEFEAPAEAVLNIIDNPIDNSPPKVHVRSDMSPNGDGIGNDFLMIEHIEKYPKNDVVVFNRWGGTVFKITGYDNKANVFKGRANTGISVGGDVPDGSYFYIVNILDRSGKKHRFTGFIVLKR